MYGFSKMFENTLDIIYLLQQECFFNLDSSLVFSTLTTGSSSSSRQLMSSLRNSAFFVRKAKAVNVEKTSFTLTLSRADVSKNGSFISVANFLASLVETSRSSGSSHLLPTRTRLTLPHCVRISRNHFLTCSKLAWEVTS